MIQEVACKYCSAPIVLDSDVLTRRGKRRPLNPDRTYHQCDGAEWAFAQIRSAQQDIEAVPAQLNRERLILDAMQYIADINLKLAGQGCYLELRRVDNEQP